ncbi:hypothetical protein ACFL2R_03515 [Patescibacteria group bacterium]
MDIDFDKIFSEKNQPEKKTRERSSNRVMPGVFIFGMLFPAFIIMYLFCRPLASFLSENNLEFLSSLFYIFFVVSAVVAISLEIKQPFSTTSNKQQKKGWIFRKMAYFVMIVYLSIMLLGTFLVFYNWDEYVLIPEGFCTIEEMRLPF